MLANVRCSRITVCATLAAVAVVAVFWQVVSAPGRLITSEISSHDVELEAISEQAERLELFARHIRKASLAAEPEPDLMFGGFVAAHDLEPGDHLDITEPGAKHMSIKIVSVRRVAPATFVAQSSSGRFDLMVVNGEILNGAIDRPEIIRLLVAVKAAPHAPPTVPDQQIL
ncbi:MAG: hypothetical protein KKB37_07325 [Alphaproteobacteria bacterium]|nr:hypothetical protein [Alphaproteobacteria bacterium]